MAIGRPAASLGGDAPHRPQLPARQTRGAAMQSHHRAVHRRFAQPASLLQPLAEPHDSAETVEHPEPLARRRADQQTAVIRAQVERSESRRHRPLPFIRERVDVLDHRPAFTGITHYLGGPIHREQGLICHTMRLPAHPPLHGGAAYVRCHALRSRVAGGPSMARSGGSPRVEVSLGQPAATGLTSRCYETTTASMPLGDRSTAGQTTLTRFI